MRNRIAIALLLVVVFVCGVSYATDWSQYESGRNNVRVDGYHGQPGYIAFTDGDGTVTGYLWCVNDTLYFASKGNLDLTTTKITTNNSGNASIVSPR